MIADEIRALAARCALLDATVADAIFVIADRVEAVERDCKQGWDNFYACRKQLAELQYPGMTGTVKAVDAAIKEQADADRAT